MIHRNVVNVAIWEDCQHCENAIVGLQENAMVAGLEKGKNGKVGQNTQVCHPEYAILLEIYTS